MDNWQQLLCGGHIWIWQDLLLNHKRVNYNLIDNWLLVASFSNLTYIEAANIELQIALVEPDIVKVHVKAPDPGPGQTLLLVLDHVDPGGWSQVGDQEAKVTSSGTKVNNNISWLSQLTQWTSQTR